MEHPCHKCGTLVEQGVPFCKQCGAPQIRVLGVESETPSARPSEGSPDGMVSPSLPILPPTYPSAQGGTVQWSRALPGAALGGVFSLLAIFISPLSMLLPSAVFGVSSMLGGALAVMLYRRSSIGIIPAAGVGVRIGAASGGFGFLYFAVLDVAKAVNRPAEVHDAMLSLASQLAAYGYAQEKVAQLQQLANVPDGTTAYLLAVLFVTLLFMLAGSSIGGAFYAAWSKRPPRS